MKKLTIKFFTAGLLYMIVLSGCSKFLDKEPTFTVKENYYKTEEEVVKGVTGLYDILGKEEVYGSNLSILLPIADEGAYYRSAYTVGTSVYNYDASERTVISLWKYLYEGIERANVLLSAIDGATMSDESRKVAKGEAKFLRAYFYFLLVSNWGDVPLKISPTISASNVNLSRTPQSEVYDFIVKEMEEAEAMVSPISAYNNAGHVTQTAVQGILARIYLSMAGYPLNKTDKYQDALKWAGKVVNAGGSYQHGLLGNYRQLFTDMAADRYNISESIWEVEFFGNRGGDFEAGRLGNINGIQCNDEALGFGYGFISVTRKLYEAFENTDTRRDWNIAPFKYTYQTGNANKVQDSTFYAANDIENRTAAKFRRVYETVAPKNKNYTPINFPLLRYADVLLMYAEAENTVNGPTANAKAAVKAVRDRASASDITTVVTGKEELLSIIKDERFRELCFEGLRKYDLIRWGEFIPVMKNLAVQINNTAPAAVKYTALAANNVTDKHLLLPVPIDELSLNKAMKQNPGW